MERSKALELCRYYKGEEECPYDYSLPEANYWSLEESWVKLTCTTPEEKSGEILEFITYFPDELSHIDVPLGLKGTMFNQYLHFDGDPKSFPNFLLAYLNHSK